MPSDAMNQVQRALLDVDELIRAHRLLTGPERGRRYQGAAIDRAAIVLAYAALEGFVEAVFRAAGEIVLDGWTVDERDDFYKRTVKRFNNASVHNTETLFMNLGILKVYDGIRWQKCSNPQVRSKVNPLTEIRNQVAHGGSPTVSLTQVRAYGNHVATLAGKFEVRVSGEILRLYGKATGW